MKVSSGTAIIWGKKILLCHPTNSSWKNTFSLPKGGVEPNESTIDAAIRETFEECGIVIDKSQVIKKGEGSILRPMVIEYVDKKGVKFKTCWVYVVQINDLSEIGLVSDVLDKSMLQMSEVDWAGFIDYGEGYVKIFHRFLPILDLIK